MKSRVVARSWDAERGVTLVEVLVVSAIIAVLALIVSSNLPSARATAQTSACETNLRNISTALEQYYSAVQTYPAGTGASVTPGLVTNPVDATVSYLQTQPVDPADPTQTATYKYSFTANTATAGAFYVLTCPGVHPKAALASVPGGAAETTGKLQLDSRNNISAI